MTRLRAFIIHIWSHIIRPFINTVTSGSYLKSPIFWARFAAYAIPLSFLAYVLYINYLPFGYNKTFTIDVGSEQDTRAGEFYLEPSKDLSERKTGTDESGNEYTYRELNGVAYAVFKPNVVLRDAEITVEVEGEGVSIIPPVIDFDPESVEWDYSWDFTEGKQAEELGLKGTAFPFDGGMYFDGKSRLELPDSEDKFEDGPFTVYLEYMPTEQNDGVQQIIGHFNWEIWQNKNEIKFQTGRMNNQNGDFYSITYPIDKTFFNNKHTILAKYSPSNNGFIELYIDNFFAGRTYFDQSKIYQDYGDRNLEFGWTSHNYGKNPFYTGFLYKAKIINKSEDMTKNKILIHKNDMNLLQIPVISLKDNSLFKKIRYDVNQ